MIKVSNPGILQVRRYSLNKINMTDVIYDIHTDMQQDCHVIDPLDPVQQKILKKGVSGIDLLVPIFRDGKLVYNLPTLPDIRSKTQQELLQFNVGVKRFLNPHKYFVGMENSLYNTKVELIKKIRSQTSQDFINPEGEDSQ